MNYSRAGSSFKPHYHRMNETLNITKEESELKENNVERNNLDAPGTSFMDDKSTNSSDHEHSNNKWPDK